MDHPSQFIELMLAIMAIMAIMAIWFSLSNYSSVKRVLIGKPMRTSELDEQHNKLIWFIALPILSADLLIASSSLLVDYILTVAVSVSAALEAVISAYPIVAPYETALEPISKINKISRGKRGGKNPNPYYYPPVYS